MAGEDDTQSEMGEDDMDDPDAPPVGQVGGKGQLPPVAAEQDDELPDSDEGDEMSDADAPLQEASFDGGQSFDD